MSPTRPIPIMIPVSGSAEGLSDRGCLDLIGTEERVYLISQHDLEDLEESGFNHFIDWVVEQREARRQYLCTQCAPIISTIL